MPLLTFNTFSDYLNLTYHWQNYQALTLPLA